MTVWGAIAGGFVGTLVLTTALRAGNELNLTRIDLPFLLGTAFTSNRTRAKALGYVLHFVVGLAFALIYCAVFLAIGRSGGGSEPSSDSRTVCSLGRHSLTPCSRLSIRAWAVRPPPPRRA